MFIDVGENLGERIIEDSGESSVEGVEFFFFIYTFLNYIF